MILSYNTNGLAHHDLADAIELIASIGYRGVAITIDHHALNPFDPHMPDQLEQVRSLLQRHEMSVAVETGARYLLDPRQKHEPTLVSRGHEDRRRRIDFYRYAIDIAQELGGTCVSIWSGVVRDQQPEEQIWRRLVESLLPVLEYAARQEMQVAMEPEPGMWIDTLASYDQLLSSLALRGVASGQLPLTIDVGHLHCQGETPIDVQLEQRARQTAHLHIEDMRAGVHEHLQFGEGEIDFPPIITALAAGRYRGQVAVELSRHSHEGPRTAEFAYNTLQPLLGSAGESSETSGGSPGP